MKRFNLLTLFFTVFTTLLPNRALADVGGLTKCSESPAFEKRLKASVKKLEQRISKYEAGSPPALALQQQIERTQARFDKYSRSELLCGTDGFSLRRCLNVLQCFQDKLNNLRSDLTVPSL